MRRQREYVDYLRDMLDAIEKAERFTQGMDLDSFRADDKTVFAVTRALEIIGEAAKKVPAEAREKCAGIPWRAIAGIRDKLIHEYFGADLEVVWRTVREDLPPLKRNVEQLLEDCQTHQQ